jgi:hypothetical protein
VSLPPAFYGGALECPENKTKQKRRRRTTKRVNIIICFYFFYFFHFYTIKDGLDIKGPRRNNRFTSVCPVCLHEPGGGGGGAKDGVHTHTHTNLRNKTAGIRKEAQGGGEKGVRVNNNKPSLAYSLSFFLLFHIVVYEIFKKKNLKNFKKVERQ